MKLKKSFIIILALIVLALVALIFCSVKGIGPFDRTPILELKGESQVTLYLGDKYQEPGYTAKDYQGNDISKKITVQKDNLSTIGKHKITYSITDNGKTVTKTRTVTLSHRKPDKTSANYGHGIPVCMYHYVYDPADPPSSLSSNWISTTDLEAHLKYLVDNKYYFPTWQELRDYVDGKIELPVKSVVLSFDDCRDSFIENGIPLLEKYDVRATSFVIGVENGKEVMKKYGGKLKHVTFQSHSYNMHIGGGNIGHGGIFTALSHNEAVSDLKKSIDILGSHDAFAYPYGDYTDDCIKAVKDAGFLCAFTTEYGTCHPGDNPLLLPRVRISNGMGEDAFAASISIE